MGNFTSCFNSELQSAKLIDIDGHLRHIKVPITAAEIMILEQPGHLVSPVENGIQSSYKLTALRADQELTNGRLYFLIPAGRLNSFVTESELEMLLSVCRKVKQVKRRRKSKVLPEEKTGGDTVDAGAGDVLGRLEEGFTGQRVCSSPMWRPVLDPIYEE
ncbi:hypothetical protein R6Q59_026274 [Mikania micrantha]|uniref:DUF4228 domain-containing protein n=1 Tax=Mikania micrantha TaxID=192012 RepID=A0A5N6PDJ0_9ASTR|nr:hypothetical protein E3N88_11491 [Mikania micrantha]